MSNFYEKSRAMNPPSYWEQGAQARANQQKMFNYWNSTLIPAGQRKWR